jgi:spermidine synthase
MRNEKLIFSGSTTFGSYRIVDMEYDGRPARVLFSGNKIAAQSGMALDGELDLLFDYNQRFLEIVTSLRPKRLLLIGGGVLTLPMALREAFPKLRIDVVEIDAELENLSREYFDFIPNERLKIIIDDGRHYVNTTTEKYDVILLDAFKHTQIPPKLASQAAVMQFARCLRPNGAVASNIISAYYGRNSDTIRNHYSNYRKVFTHVAIIPASRSLLSFWLPQNFILVAQSGTPESLMTRYDALEPPNGL